MPLMAAFVSLLLAGCVLPTSSQPRSAVSSADDAIACRESLGQRHAADHDSLDSTAIRLLNWNVHKGGGSQWWADHEAMLQTNHLVLLQEAMVSENMVEDGYGARFVSFAQGFTTRRAMTGVATFSQIPPLTVCSLSVREPWLRTPKAMSITEFGLSGTDQTLVVVNLHAVNFAIGLAALNNQLERVFDAVQGHRGPLVVSGDFNTWRGGRARALQLWTERFELTAVEFADDQRVRIFGQYLDQIYVRQLQVVTSSTDDETSSDHNPMFVTLQL